MLNNSQTKIEDTLYLRILNWAYRRQENGFHWEELQKQFQLTPEQDYWVQQTFRGSIPKSENLIDHLAYKEKGNEHIYALTPKGNSEAINYLNLKQAEKNSQRAEKLAIVAIIIGAIVGIAQIISGICLN